GIAVLDATDGVLVAATSGSPLVVAMGEGEAHLASDPAALQGVNDRVVLLDDGHLAVIEPGHLRVMNMALGAWVTPRTLPAEALTAEAALASGEHWMWREIGEQPRLLRLLAGDAVPDVVALAEAIRVATSVTWVGCGTAYHAALYGRYVLAQTGERSHAVPGSEFS